MMMKLMVEVSYREVLKVVDDSMMMIMMIIMVAEGGRASRKNRSSIVLLHPFATRPIMNNVIVGGSLCRRDSADAINYGN